MIVNFKEWLSKKRTSLFLDENYKIKKYKCFHDFKKFFINTIL
jgi:hypothetical protein